MQLKGLSCADGQLLFMAHKMVAEKSTQNRKSGKRYEHYWNFTNTFIQHAHLCELWSVTISLQHTIVEFPPASSFSLHKFTTAGLSSRAVSASDCGVRGPRFESHRGQLCFSRRPLRYTALGTGCAPLLQCLGRLSLPPSVGR